MTVAQILQRSSNVGTDHDRASATSARRGLKKWMAHFGFGQRTGIDFPGESRGLLPSYWSGSTIGNVPIGQGVSVTAIQLASVYAAIANDGVWMQPHLVDHVPAGSRRRRSGAASSRRGVDSQLLTMLKGVVSDQGTAAARRDPRLHRRRQDGHGAEAGPERLHPRQVRRDLRRDGAGAQPAARRARHRRRAARAIFGGLVAAPAFAQIASFDLQYLEVPPDLRIR